MEFVRSRDDKIRVSARVLGFSCYYAQNVRILKEIFVIIKFMLKLKIKIILSIRLSIRLSIFIILNLYGLNFSAISFTPKYIAAKFNGFWFGRCVIPTSGSLHRHRRSPALKSTGMIFIAGSCKICCLRYPIPLYLYCRYVIFQDHLL